MAWRALDEPLPDAPDRALRDSAWLPQLDDCEHITAKYRKARAQGLDSFGEGFYVKAP